MLQHNVIGITGSFGGGKSLRAVELAIRFANRTRKPLVFNFPVNETAIRAYARSLGYFWVSSCARILYVDLFDDINRLWTYRNSVFVLDEAGIFANARLWKSLSKDFLKNLVQVRKLNVHLIIVFQYIDQVDKQIRQNIQHWVWCRSWSIYSNKLQAPRMFARFAFHYDVEKFLRLQEDTRARGNIIMPWFWAELVFWRYLFVFELFAFIKNTLFELIHAAIFTATVGKKSFRFRRQVAKEQLLFLCFRSKELLGHRNTLRTYSELMPSPGSHSYVEPSNLLT